MDLITIMRFVVLFGLLTLIGFGCSSSRYLSDCDELEITDTTKYFVLMDHNELKKDWLKEEIDKNNIQSWFTNYVDNITSDISELDSLQLKNIKQQQFDSYFKKWQQFENKILNQDRVFYYSTPKEYWKILAGQDGLVLIRQCKVIYVLILMQS